jgi:hypothetical protein
MNRITTKPLDSLEQLSMVNRDRYAFGKLRFSASQIRMF